MYVKNNSKKLEIIKTVGLSLRPDSPGFKVHYEKLKNKLEEYGASLLVEKKECGYDRGGGSLF